jgi:ketosteroid isomerase-like protein
MRPGTKEGAMAHPNADLVRKGYEAALAGDMATFGGLIADDAKWHWPAPGAEVFGKEAVLAMLAEPMPESTSWQSEIHAVLADDEHAVALIKNTVVRNGETIQNDVVQVYHVADGQVTEAWVAPIDPAAFAALFGA